MSFWNFPSICKQTAVSQELSMVDKFCLHIFSYHEVPDPSRLLMHQQLNIILRFSPAWSERSTRSANQFSLQEPNQAFDCRTFRSSALPNCRPIPTNKLIPLHVKMIAFLTLKGLLDQIDPKLQSVMKLEILFSLLCSIIFRYIPCLDKFCQHLLE